MILATLRVIKLQALASRFSTVQEKNRYSFHGRDVRYVKKKQSLRAGSASLQKLNA